MVLEAIPVTVSLVLGGAIIWMLIAIPVGILSAVRPRSLLDRSATVIVLIGISTHPVWIGLLFSYYFGSKLELFPSAVTATSSPRPRGAAVPRIGLTTSSCPG